MQASGRLRPALRRYGGWYVMLLIPIIGTLAFNIGPLVVLIANSFQNTAGTYIGTVNYGILLSDSEFHDALVNTLYMGVLGVFISVPVAFFWAYMLNRVPALKNAFKTIYLLPMVMSVVSAAMIFKFIFSADPAGMANFVLSKLGIPPQGWFAAINQARETVIVYTLWKSLGYSIILFYAGLQTLPTELYEASDIDGANEWHKLRYVIIPCMRNTLVFVYITNSIGALKRFADVYAISSEYGYPANRLITLMLYVYRKSFSTLFYKDTGVAASASVVLFLLILVITLINFKATGESENLLGDRRGRRG